MMSQSFPVCKSLSSPPGQPTRAQNRKLALLFRNAPVLARDLCLGRREQRGDVCLKVCDLSRQQVLLRGIPSAVGGMKVVSIASAAEAAPQFGAVAAGQRRFVGRGGLGRGGGGGGERPARAKRLYLGLQQCYLLFQSSLLLRQRLQFAQCGQPGQRAHHRVRERSEGEGAQEFAHLVESCWRYRRLKVPVQILRVHQRIRSGRLARTPPPPAGTQLTSIRGRILQV